MKYTTVKISEIAAHPTMRLDPGYWLNKKSCGQSASAQGLKLQKRFDIISSIWDKMILIKRKE